MSSQNGSLSESGVSAEASGADDDAQIVFAAVAKIFHLARFLNGENPRAAEFLYALGQRPELEEAIERGEGVVQYVMPGETGPPPYIVVRNGTRSTTSSRPDWVKDEEIQLVEIPEPEPYLVPELEKACGALREASPETYEKLRIDELLNNVKSFSANHEYRDVINQLRVMTSLEKIQLGSGLESSDAEIEKWVADCRAKLIKDYHGFLISSDTILPALGTLFFFGVVPVPASHLYAIGLPQNASDVLGSGKRINALPTFNFEFYFSCLSRGGFWGVDIAAVRTAQKLQRIAEERCRTAKEQLSFELFHSRLFDALLYCRCAQFIYARLLALEERSPGAVIQVRSLLTEAKQGQYICEEIRVQIMVSLASFHRRDLLRVGEARSFWNWVLALGSIEPSAAKLQISSLSLLLMLPNFLEEIARGWLLLSDPDSFSRGSATLLDVAEQLEGQLPTHVIMGEPNYLHFLYLLLADTFEHLGMQERARTLREKARPRPFETFSAFWCAENSRGEG